MIYVAAPPPPPQPYPTCEILPDLFALGKLVPNLVKEMGEAYPELVRAQSLSTEIVKLDDYIKDNKNVYYYRLFSVNKSIDNAKIFNYLSKTNNENTKFNFIPYFTILNKDELLKNNSYNCLSFLLKMLYEFKIIPVMNYTYFLSDDLICLPELSKSFYNKEIIFSPSNNVS